VPLPNGPCDGKGPSREGVSTLATDRLDLNGIDLAGQAREDVLAALTDAAIEAYEDAAEFYSPDQARDWRGRWTSGGGSDGGQSVPTHAERGQLRQASLQAVRDYVRAGGEPSRVENEQLAAHLARLTVQQLHQVKAEHGLKASGKDKTALVGKLAERFRAHRATQAPAGKRALEEAVAGKPGFHNVREVLGGHAVSHGPTGSQVRADHAGTRFDVLTSGSTLHSSHATAAAAVKAAEASNRFGTGQSTAEEESRARHEAIANAQKRAAAEKPASRYPAGQGYTVREESGLGGQKVYRLYEPDGRPAYRGFQSREEAEKEAARLNARGPLPVHEMKPPAAAPPAPAGGGKAPHEMALHEWMRAHGAPESAVQKVMMGTPSAGGRRVNPQTGATISLPDSMYRPHYRAVKQALEEGRHVPEHVLQDYPDLQARHRRGRSARFSVEGALTPPARVGDRVRWRTLGGEIKSGVLIDIDNNTGIVRLDSGEEVAVAGADTLAPLPAVGFSVVGALSPEEAEERATLRQVQSYADRENARLRAVREGVRA
jgi:hypothetical protein